MWDEDNNNVHPFCAESLWRNTEKLRWHWHQTVWRVVDIDISNKYYGANFSYRLVRLPEYYF